MLQDKMRDCNSTLCNLNKTAPVTLFEVDNIVIVHYVI